MPTESRGVFPSAVWETGSPEAHGFQPGALEKVRAWQENRDPGARFRVVVVRGGRIVAEWEQGVDRAEALPQASASKSTYACVLGIAVEEGKIRSADDRVVDYYPEMMDVPPGTGPKEGRHAFAEDEGITFRQLIGNTSGYMKPGESPGKVFHYQTFGMNVLTHAIAAQYNLYKTAEPERGAGFGKLVEWKIRNPIQGTWTWRYSNFQLPAKARLGIFGYNTNLVSTARDHARLGLLWLHYGNWRGSQIVPEPWLREATRTNPMILAHEPEEKWQYGLGFWTNDKDRLWPDLPSDSFAASGAGSQHIWVCPRLDLVVVQSPGTYQPMEHAGAAALIEKLLDAME